MTDEHIPVPMKKDWVDPCEEDPAEDAVTILGRLVAGCRALNGVLEYDKHRVRATANEHW